MSDVGDSIKAERASWSFGGNVCETFDQHVRRSVPLYEVGHELICKLSDFFISNGSICYEIGCSTGELTINMARHNKNKAGARFIGIDIEENMISKAKEKAAGVGDVEFVVDDLLQYQYEAADLIVAYYTVQFVRPAQRQKLIDLIYKRLNWGGAFVMFEKVRGPDARFQDIVTSLYTDFKLDQGYNGTEIVSKSQSLKGILEPFSTQGNIDLLKRAGFVDYMTIMKYVCFEGFLAIK